MFFWIDFSSWWMSILSILGIGILACIAWLVLYIGYRLITDNFRRPQRLRMDRPNVNAPDTTRMGFLGRSTVFLGSMLGGMWGWWLQSNNRRARVILLVLTLATVAFMFLYLPYAYHHAQPNGLRDAVFTETFGQKPLSQKSLSRSAYIPNPDEFYGYTSATAEGGTKEKTGNGEKPASPVTASDAQSGNIYSGSSILWLFFWMFAFMPFAWACAILYAVLSLREETWNVARAMVMKLRDWVSNMGESGIRGTRSVGGAQGGLTFSTPLVMTSSGAVAAEADKPKAEVPWAKIMQWVKRNSGEIVAGLFVIDELLELGAVRKKHRTPKD